MKIWKPVSKYLYVLVFLITIYIILGIATSAIPNELIKENSKLSSEYLLENKENPDIIERNTSYKREYIFNYTNALMLNTAFSIDESKPLESFLLNRNNFIPGITEKLNEDTQYGLISLSNNDYYQNQAEAYYNLTHEDNNKTIKESFEYARYWHGYLVILRPALVFLSYEKIENISMACFVILLIICTVLMWKKVDKMSAFLFFLSFIAMNVFYTSGSINEIACFIIMLISSIYIILRHERTEHIPLIFIIIGSVTNFFDLLTLPLLTFAIPACIYFLMCSKDEQGSFKKYMILFINIGLAWLIGYGITWIEKWVLVDLICNRNVTGIALKQIIYRMSSSDGRTEFTYSYVLSENKKFLGNQVIYFAAIVSAAIMGAGIIRNRNTKLKINPSELLIFLIIAILPFIWYIALKNHSAMHARYTHRLVFISIYSFWMFLAKIWGFDKEDRIKDYK